MYRCWESSTETTINTSETSWTYEREGEIDASDWANAEGDLTPGTPGKGTGKGKGKGKGKSKDSEIKEAKAKTTLQLAKQAQLQRLPIKLTAPVYFDKSKWLLVYSMPSP